MIAGNHNQNNSNKGNPPHTSVINVNDTVVLDLSQQVLVGNYTSFPVSILTDDTIFSLDFSFKYNQNDFVYDTMVDIATSLQSLSYYNSNDSTVRYTGYSLQNISIDTPLVSIHFTTLTGKICSQDFNTVKGYLNGELCSIKLITCISGSPSGLHDINNKNTSLNIYPNPASEILNVVSDENAIIELCDLNGRTVLSQTEIQTGEKLQLGINDIANGFYILKTYNGNFSSNQKVVINH